MAGAGDVFDVMVIGAGLASAEPRAPRSPLRAVVSCAAPLRAMTSANAPAAPSPPVRPPHVIRTTGDTAAARADAAAEGISRRKATAGRGRRPAAQHTVSRPLSTRSRDERRSLDRPDGGHRGAADPGVGEPGGELGRVLPGAREERAGRPGTGDDRAERAERPAGIERAGEVRAERERGRL